MNSFKDNAGREWILDINVESVDEVHKATDVLLTKLCDDEFKLLAELELDQLKLAAVIWTLIYEQAEKANVTVRQFRQAFSGDAIYNAWLALGGAAIDFLPNPARRAGLQAIFQTALEAQARLATEATQRIQESKSDLLENAYSSFASSMQASPELSPGDSPMVSST